MIPHCSPLKTILIGYGKMGKNHFRVINNNKHFKLTAVIDPEVTQSQFPLDSDIQAFQQLSDIEHIEWDCAVIAAPTELHYEITNSLLNHKKPLLLEKPLAATPAHAQDLLAKSERLGVKLAVGHVERFNPAVGKLKEIIAAKWLGELIHLSFTRVGGYPSHVDPGNNVLVDLAIHDLDVLQFLVGPMSVRESICHSTWKDNILDTAEILLANNTGISAAMHVNWITPTKIRTLRVTGTQGVCFVDYMLQSVTLLGGNLLKKSPDSEFNFDSLCEAYKATDRVEFGIQKQEPLKIQLENFYNYIRGYSSEICSASDALLAVILAHESIRKANV